MKARTLLDGLCEAALYRVEPWSEDAESYDCWEMEEEAQALFKRAGLSTRNSRKTPGLLAIDNRTDKLLGCTFHRTYNFGEEHPDELPEGHEDVQAYDFDLAVDPSQQNGTLGYLLTQASIQEARLQGCYLIRLWVINPRMAQMLEQVFHFQFEDEQDERTDNPGGQYSSHMTLFLR